MKRIIKNIFIGLSVFTCINASAQVDPIIQVRASSLGSRVTAVGVVTNGSPLGAIRYFQDATAGIAAYGGNVNGITIGDSIEVTGILTEFNGLMEIGSTTSAPTYRILGNVTPVVPQLISIPAVGESLEGMLVKINNVAFQVTGNFQSGQNYILKNGTNTITFRTPASMNGTPIPTGPQTVIGIVSQFNDYQIIARGIASDITPYVAPQREIDVLFEGVNKVSGSTIYFSGPATKTVKIENHGVGVLTVSNIALSGANADKFSVTSTSTTIAGGQSQDIPLTFTPTVGGSHSAVLTIANDDSDESSYVLNIVAGGSDGLMTEPTANPTAILFSNVKAYTLSGAYDAVTSATNYIVLWKEGTDAITEAPVDGTSYLRGDQVGTTKVAYVGTGLGFTPRGIRANKDYSFAVFAFNGQEGSENYKTTTPAISHGRSAGADAGNYYSTITAGSPTFVSDLTTKLQNRTMITYYNYKQTFMQEFELRDTTAGKSFVECRYSKHKEVFEGNFDWVAQDFSREHVYAHSWMPGNPYNNSTPEKIAYNDQHNLFPVKQTKVNATRSNYPFGEVVTPLAGLSYMEGERGLDAAGNSVYEPREDVKGDIARALFFHSVAYNNFQNTGIWGFKDEISMFIPYGQDVNLLLEWHMNDLPDSYEIARHEYVASIQNNRNPFIDHPEWACNINFKTMQVQACTAGVDKSTLNDINVYPNPVLLGAIKIEAANNELKAWEIVDIQGKSVLSGTLSGVDADINVTQLNAGTYIIKISTVNGLAIKKVIIQ